MCRLKQARIFCTSSASKHTRLKQLGADFCFAYSEKFQQTFDVVFDSIGGDSFRKSYALLAPFGRLCIYGASSFISSSKQNLIAALVNLLRFPIFFPLSVINSSRSICGFGVLGISTENSKLQGALRDVTRIWAEGNVHPIIDKSFPLAKIAEAQTYLEERRNFGKVILIV
uniref:Putative medium chain dehydrogenases/reductase n=1 Tax=uncultured bacterium CSL142 TaxID=1091569 RepID=G4WVN2_9BACT|nr:putative medium chain dehydrogenases/reductase [uncultured bacterium CSL142]